MSDQIETIRPNTVYISWQTHACLGILAKALYKSRDDIAEEVLAAWLKAEHPSIGEHAKQRHEADKKFVADLQAKLGTAPKF